MNQTPGKNHLTTLDILIELRCWLTDNRPSLLSSLICPMATCSPKLTVSRLSIRCCISCGTNQCPEETSTMRLPNPYSLEETLEKLRHGLTTACKEDAQVLLEKAVTKARDNEVYAKQFEETLLRGSTIEIRECLNCFGDYFGRSRDSQPYYPHHDAVNGIDAILFDAAHPEAEQAHE